MSVIRHYNSYKGRRVPYIVGAKGGCFPAGTAITMADGSTKPIEDIKNLDVVLAFNKNGVLSPATVSETFYHENDEFITIKHWAGEFTVTPNHWILADSGLFLEAGQLTTKDQVVTKDGQISPIESIEPAGSGSSYNFTVSKAHTYIANDVRVHNKGGGKGGGTTHTPVEAENSLFSTDILFVTNAVGEGPVYRINPNGPQDIEIQDGGIDDLINLDGDGRENTEKFKTISNTGTVTQSPLRVFGEEIVTPQNFQSPVRLKKGNVAGIPKSSVELQDTSADDWDALRFSFTLNSLLTQSTNGDINGHSISLRIRIFNRAGTETIADTGDEDTVTAGNATISGKTNTPFKFTITVLIPEEKRSTDGYKFTVEKTSGDSEKSTISEEIQLSGWFEIKYKRQAYPRTAHIGYAIKAHSEYTGGVPNFTSLIKGLLVKVPSNYNQPILETGEIDWRELELPETGTAEIDGVSGVQIGYTQRGYRLQQSGLTVQTSANPVIYKGVWDGTFIYAWSQNPVWITYDILTNKTYGLGIAEENIDKFKFYQVAQYCDACNVITGAFEGIDSLADGTFRHKPRGLFTDSRENQFGLSSFIKIKERRFICDCTIVDQSQAMDTINQITSIFRGALVYSGGKITLAVDMPNEIPVAVFNESNIKDGSFQISGIKESDILTGVDVSYIDPTNHFKREVVRIDTTDRNDGVQKSEIENVASLDLFGVTRRSQALRYAQYHIAASKFLRRRAQWTTSAEALLLSPGDVVSVAQRNIGIAWGYAGKVVSNSTLGSDTVQAGNVILEHLTTPSLSASVFTANTNPLILRVFRSDRDRIELFLLSNTDYQLLDTGNVTSGFDRARVNVISKYNYITQAFDSGIDSTGFQANDVPTIGDLWTLGEIDDPNNIYSAKSDKLFKITSITRNEDHEVVVDSIEYVSNIYVDSDTFIDYTPTDYIDTTSPLRPPPAPQFKLQPLTRREQDGSLTTDLFIDVSTERTGYGLAFATEFEIMRTDESQTMLSGQLDTNVNAATFGTLSFTPSNTAALADATGVAVLVGKNGFDTNLGEIRLLCNSVAAIDDSSSIRFTVEGLNVAFDTNIGKHVLRTNDGSIPLKGIDQLSFPIIGKTDTPLLIQNFGGQLTEYSANITAFNETGDDIDLGDALSIEVENTENLGIRLVDLLPPAPFYVTINQLLDSRYLDTTPDIYVAGSDITYIRNNTFVSGASTHVEPLEITPRDKNFITVYVDGIKKTAGQFTFNKDTSPPNITYTIEEGEETIKVLIDHYTVPAIEIGDNVQILSDNVFSVANVSYDPADPSYNAALTSNNIYSITLSKRPRSNVSGFTAINISPNPIGVIANVNQSAANFTFDYNKAIYPGNFNLANNYVYDVAYGEGFEKVFLTENRTIRNLSTGTTIVRARNKNRAGRASPYVTKALTIENLLIPKVQNVVITESLYKEQVGGVAVRAIVAFDHLQSSEVTDYEVSYRITGESADLTSFTSVKVPATAVDSDGKVRYLINNIDRGASSQVNTLNIRITPLNKDIRGQTTTVTQTILGKTAPPQNVTNFTGGQLSDQITFFWSYPRTNDELSDLDLKEVVIRRIPGTATINSSNFVIADAYHTEAAGGARFTVNIDTFGTFTYLVRTRDTSGNFSESVTGLTLTTTRPVRNTVIAAYNEDSPGTTFAGIVNTNSAEENFASFSTSNNGGINNSSVPSSVVDNANGSSSGWSAIAASPTDLLAAGDATYITQIRDLGSTVTGSLFVDIEGTQAVQTTYNDYHTVLFSGVTETSTGPAADVLQEDNFGGIGTVLGFSNSTLTFNYSDVNKTLVDTTTTANVYAIWNPGQYTGNVISISAITQASPAVVTTVGSEHGLVDGDRIIIHDVTGMTEINDKEVYVTRDSATAVSLFTDSARTTPLNSTGFTAYSSSGVLDQGDYANANSYALIASVINANHVALGTSYHANGDATGTNAFANITQVASTYQLVDLSQFSDLGSSATFEGTLGTISTTAFVRTSTETPENLFQADPTAADPAALQVVQANFTGGSSTNDGFLPYETGTKTFRFFQIKFVVNNNEPNQFDFTIDKLRYTIEKEKLSFTESVVFDGVDKVVDLSSANFVQVPVVSLDVTSSANALAAPIAVTTELSATQLKFNVFFTSNGVAHPADSTATVSVTATGV